MSKLHEIREVYLEDIIKIQKMTKSIVAEPLGEVVEDELTGDQSKLSWCGMCTYFILDEKSNAVKIGHTRGLVVDRMVDVQVGNPNKLRIIGVIPKGDSKEYAEQELHRGFKDFHMCGEWFRYNDEIKSFIRNLPKYCQQEESP